jgi:hypothetical protein
MCFLIYHSWWSKAKIILSYFLTPSFLTCFIFTHKDRIKQRTNEYKRTSLIEKKLHP